jgi:hypothetical protein
MREMNVTVAISMAAPSVDASRRHLPRCAGEDQPGVNEDLDRDGSGAPPFTGELSAKPTEGALCAPFINRGDR